MHPGGKRRIVNQCGGDATNAFENAGHSSRAYSLLGGYLVGTLQ
jgi:cytochrome b involved in lipid metabolism